MLAQARWHGWRRGAGGCVPGRRRDRYAIDYAQPPAAMERALECHNWFWLGVSDGQRWRDGIATSQIAASGLSRWDMADPRMRVHARLDYRGRRTAEAVIAAVLVEAGYARREAS